MVMRRVGQVVVPMLCALMACTQANAGEVLERIRREGAITVAYRDSASPFSSVPAGATAPVGYAIDLCSRIIDGLAQELKRPIAVRHVRVSVTDRIQTIASGAAQLECGSTTNTAERRQQVAFTVPHYVTGTRLLVKTGGPVRDLRGLGGKTVVATTGTTALPLIRKLVDERMLGARVIEAPTYDAAIAMLSAGQADAFVLDEVMLYMLRARQPKPEQFEAVDKFLSIEPLAIMLPPGDSEFKAAVDGQMKKLIRSNTAHELYARWFTSPLPDGVNLQQPMNYLLRAVFAHPSDYVPE